jgi:hypothetical protein
MKTLPDAVMSKLPALRGNPLAKLISNFSVVNGDPIKNPNSSEFEVDNWVISEFIVKKILPFVGFHPFPLNELHLMVAATCRFRPTHIFEWGTHTGKSARIFYETTKYWAMQTQIHSIDLPGDVHHAEHLGPKRGALVRNKPRVHLHLGDGVDTAMSLLTECSAQSRILFFIDGDHSFESVRRELTSILNNANQPKILLHDTFYQSNTTGHNNGPHMAIESVLAELRGQKPFRIIQTKTGLPGMTLLY